MAYPFLSDEWIAAARGLREEYRSAVVPIGQTVRINLVVQEVPFGNGEIEAHMDTSSGQLELDTGHVAEHDLRVTVDYVTARSIIVEGNPQAAMQAFINGKIQVEGDIAKLLVLQTSPQDPRTQEFGARLREITAG